MQRVLGPMKAFAGIRLSIVALEWKVWRFRYFHGGLYKEYYKVASVMVLGKLAK